MFPQTENQLTSLTITVPGLRRYFEGWLTAKRAERKSSKTLEYYAEMGGAFVAWCEARNVTTLDAIDAGLLREYLLHLESAGHMITCASLRTRSRVFG